MDRVGQMLHRATLRFTELNASTSRTASTSVVTKLSVPAKHAVSKTPGDRILFVLAGLSALRQTSLNGSAFQHKVVDVTFFLKDEALLQVS